MTGKVVAFVLPEHMPLTTTTVVIQETIDSLLSLKYDVYIVPETSDPSTITPLLDSPDLLGVVKLCRPGTNVLSGTRPDHLRVINLEDMIETGLFDIENVMRDLMRVQLQHVVANGSKHLVIATMKNWSIPHVDGRFQRIFLESCKKFGIDDVTMLEMESSPRDGYWTICPDSARQAIAEIMAERPQTDCFICTGDEVALAVVNALWDNGHPVPADVNVISFGDTELGALVEPPLTSVNLNPKPAGFYGAISILKNFGVDIPRAEVDKVVQYLNVRRSG